MRPIGQMGMAFADEILAPQAAKADNPRFARGDVRCCFTKNYD